MVSQVPLLGRVGSRFPLDAALGAVVGLLTGLVALLLPRLPKPRRRESAAFLGALLLGAVFCPDFTPDRPKRLTIQHISRDLHGQKDAGLWVLPMDGQRLAHLPRLQRMTPVACDKSGPECYLERAPGAEIDARPEAAGPVGSGVDAIRPQVAVVLPIFRHCPRRRL